MPRIYCPACKCDPQTWFKNNMGVFTDILYIYASWTLSLIRSALLTHLSTETHLNRQTRSYIYTYLWTPFASCQARTCGNALHQWASVHRIGVALVLFIYFEISQKLRRPACPLNQLWLCALFITGAIEVQFGEAFIFSVSSLCHFLSSALLAARKKWPSLSLLSPSPIFLAASWISTLRAVINL